MMSGSKRRSTVHDLAALRLHPDGSRVALSRTNKTSRKAKYATQDHRGNWIAQDAGGIGRVKTRRAAAKEGEENRAQENEDEDSQIAGPSTPNVDKGKGRALDGEENDDEPKDPRAKKRKLFHADIGLQGSSSRQDVGLDQPSGLTHDDAAQSMLTSVPNPTSDLLKCIHYFASTYYSEMGQLRDSSKEYRREKKLRRLKRLEQQAQRHTSKSMDNDQPDEDEGDSETSSSEENSSESEEQNNTSKAGKSRRRSRNARQFNAHVGTDMYKVFDGTALMAIGMLLQHHVEDLMDSCVPEGWEKAMERESTPPKRSRIKERTMKTRDSEDEFDEQFLDDLEREADAGLEDSSLLKEIVDGDGDMDEDYVPDTD